MHHKVCCPTNLDIPLSAWQFVLGTRALTMQPGPAYRLKVHVTQQCWQQSADPWQSQADT